MSYDVELTTTAAAAGSVLYVHVMTSPEAAALESNVRADAALAAGLRGDYALVEALAELADLYAVVVVVHAGLDRINASLDRINGHGSVP